MSGGLRPHNDEENGPSHAVGYKSSKKQDSYSLERNQCVCAVEEVCPDLQKPEPKSLDRTGVVRDVGYDHSTTAAGHAVFMRDSSWELTYDWKNSPHHRSQRRPRNARHESLAGRRLRGRRTIP